MTDGNATKCSHLRQTGETVVDASQVLMARRPAAYSIAHLMAIFLLNFRLKMQKLWRAFPENDDFLLKNGHLM